jgi:two-component system chemotaxis sensor kinase CheA
VTPRFGEIATPLVDQAPSWAEKEQKDVRIEIDGRDVGVSVELGRVLGGVLTHLVRNAIAHGVEKKGFVLLQARAGEREGIPLISVEDDGAGIPDEGPLAQAAERNTPLSYAQTSFRPSGSDSGSLLAGRGVGLAAVTEDLARANYAIWVEHREPRGTRFVLKPRPAGGVK